MTCTHEPNRAGSCHECCKDALETLRVLFHDRKARLAEAERWQVAVMSGYEVLQAMGPTTLSHGDVSNVLDAVAKVARATDSASGVHK